MTNQQEYIWSRMPKVFGEQEYIGNYPQSSEIFAFENRVYAGSEPNFRGPVAQQDLAFKMTHIEAKSINIWLRYDSKHNITSCFHTSTQIMRRLSILGHMTQISAKCGWILVNVDDLKALALHH